MLYPPRPSVQCSPDRIITFDTGEYIAQPKLVNYKAIRDSTNSSVLAAFNQTSTRIKIPPVQFNEIKLSNGN